MKWREGYIAVDWGTTNRRAWAIDPLGAVVGQFADARGLKALSPQDFAPAAAEIRARLGDLPMLLAGMVGSNKGWREAPYVPCPADAAALARAITWIEPGRTGIIPGVAQTSPADVMRGEEVQVLGAVASGQLQAESLVCHPGTHAKWIVVAEGKIAAFRTMMTGEVFALLSRHSILADQLDAPVQADAAFIAGVDESLSGGALLSGLFAIRARHLLGQGSSQAASTASGLLIGADVRAGLALLPSRPVTLIGRPDLCSLYAAAIARAGGTTATIEDSTAFLAGMHMMTEMIDG